MQWPHGKEEVMIVSHYWVSGIQVGGLILGLLGFFYLSLGLFGRTGFNLFRPILPAIAVAVTECVYATFFLPFAVTWDSWTFAFYAATAFIAGYAGGLFVSRHRGGRALRIALVVTVADRKSVV